MITEKVGDVIQAALDGEIDVICHGVNCFCTMKKGFALDMVREFQCDDYPMEYRDWEGDVDKLGRIEFKLYNTNQSGSVWVVNAYTQYHYVSPSRYGVPLDYDALRLCFRKINQTFPKERVGIPGLLGAGLAGGRPEIIKQILKEECIGINLIIFYPKGVVL